MKKHHSHIGDSVKIGPYKILAGGTFYLTSVDLGRVDVIVPLTEKSVPFAFGAYYRVLACPMKDFGGVPPYWKEFLEGAVIPLLEEGTSVMAFCEGGHGRTGTFLASLIALLESEEETPDPIQAVRERYCENAVETIEQIEAIFALRGQDLSEKYRQKS